MLASEMVAAARTQRQRVACLVDLPPSRPSKTRYVVHRLRAPLPDLTIVVCRWSAPTLADEDPALADPGGSQSRQHVVGRHPELPARTGAGVDGPGLKFDGPMMSWLGFHLG